MPIEIIALLIRMCHAQICVIAMTSLHFLDGLWDNKVTAGLDKPDLLSYSSTLPGHSSADAAVVIKASTMFPRDRVITSLRKYGTTTGHLLSVDGGMPEAFLR
jgi:hypothetical protein